MYFRISNLKRDSGLPCNKCSELVAVRDGTREYEQRGSALGNNAAFRTSNRQNASATALNPAARRKRLVLTAEKPLPLRPGARGDERRDKVWFAGLSAQHGGV